MQSTTSDEVAHRESVGTGAGTDGNDAEKEYERIDHRLITKRVPRLTLIRQRIYTTYNHKTIHPYVA